MATPKADYERPAKWVANVKLSRASDRAWDINKLRSLDENSLWRKVQTLIRAEDQFPEKTIQETNVMGNIKRFGDAREILVASEDVFDTTEAAALRSASRAFEEVPDDDSAGIERTYRELRFARESFESTARDMGFSWRESKIASTNLEEER